MVTECWFNACTAVAIGSGESGEGCWCCWEIPVIAKLSNASYTWCSFVILAVFGGQDAASPSHLTRTKSDARVVAQICLPCLLFLSPAMATWRMSNVISLCVESGRVTSNFSWACQSLKERISLFPSTDTLSCHVFPKCPLTAGRRAGRQAYRHPAMQKTENEPWKFVACGLSAASSPRTTTHSPYRKYTKLIAYLSNIHTLPAVTGSSRYPNFPFLSCWFVESGGHKKISDIFRRKIELILKGNDFVGAYKITPFNYYYILY